MVALKNIKAHFVARGFSQKEGIDFEETFAPVARYTSVRAVISIEVAKDWEHHQMVVKSSFLNGSIEEEVYLEQLKGSVTHDVASYVCKLKRALYGLK